MKKHPFPSQLQNIRYLLTATTIFTTISYYTAFPKNNNITQPPISSSPPQQQQQQQQQLKPSIINQQLKPSIILPPKQLLIPTIHYVLVGAGTASYHAMLSIKSLDPLANILIIGSESYPPYQRPPLSKELWNNDGSISNPTIFQDYSGKHTNLFYNESSISPQITSLNTTIHTIPSEEFDSLNTPDSRVKLLLQSTVTCLDPENKLLTLSDSRQIKYDKVLLATGGTPKMISFANNLPENAKEKVFTFRGLNDFQKLYDLQASGNKTIAIIGGGFLGSELSIALAKKSKQYSNNIIQVFPESGNMGLVFPRYLTKWTTSRLKKEGVAVKPNSEVVGLQATKDDKVRIELKNCENIDADCVVVAIGLDPNISIAQASGLELDEKRGGILVNAELEARSDVFAAGDCVSFHDILLGRRRVEHYDHAVMSGSLAGLNMVGEKKPYRHQSMFWSDLGPEIGYEAVGKIDSSLSTVGIWANDKNHPRTAEENDAYHKGVVFYLDKQKKLAGVLLFNVFGQLEIARNLLNEGKTYKDPYELSKLFEGGVVMKDGKSEPFGFLNWNFQD